MKYNLSRHQGENSYKFKYIYLILCLIFVVAIIATYILPKMLPQFFVDSEWILEVDSETNIESIRNIPENTAMIIIRILRDVFISGLVGVILYAFYEHRFESEEKQALIDGVNNILSENIESHIIKAMLASKEINEQVLSSELIDELLYNCLVRKTGNEAKANAVMKSILENIINKSTAIKDLDVSMMLDKFPDAQHRYCAYATYKMTYVIRYKVILNANVFTFILTNNKTVQNKNLGIFAFCQFIDSSFTGQEVYFNVNEITIDGIPLSKQGERVVRDEYIKEEYWNDLCNSKKGEEVLLLYSVDFLIRKYGNHYSYFTPSMASDIHLKFDASRTDIMRIKLLPYFNSSEKPTILLRDGNNPKTIEITLNDWVLPLSGATFIWQFEKKQV